MDHHEQDPREHGLGGAQNGEHGFDREVEDRDHASNAGEIEAQTRTMREYMNPARQTPISAIVLPAHHTTLNLRSGMLQALPHFNGCESERPYTHLEDFEDACSIFQDNSCPREILLLKVFPFTLKNKAKFWFISLRPRSIYSWNAMEGELLKKFFPKNRTEALRHAISQFVPNSGESFFQAWACTEPNNVNKSSPSTQYVGVKYKLGVEDDVNAKLTALLRQVEALAHAKAATSLTSESSSMCVLCDTMEHCTGVCSIVARVKEARGQVNVTATPQSQPMPYSAPQALSLVPQHAQYQPPYRRNEDNELRTKVTSIEQQLGKMNSILESLVISQQMQGQFPAQPQQNPKPANCIEEIHEQVQAITTLRSGKEIDKIIAPKRVIQGRKESKDLGGESERQKNEEERKSIKGQKHEHDSEPATKVSNKITVEDLKHAPYPQRDASIVSEKNDFVMHVGHWTPTFEPLAPSVVKPVPSEEKPPIPKRKPLPSTIKYAFLGEGESYPVVISSSLTEGQEESLLKLHCNATATLSSHRLAITALLWLPALVATASLPNVAPVAAVGLLHAVAAGCSLFWDPTAAGCSPLWNIAVVIIITISKISDLDFND
ncbi:hypothetical protein Acr_17g0008330 [Actinidia rufa]|uniref:Retrotransposon gag domain-containing protein n=1 Tax=Actinidia rufa TaxID=165716 RepID=A0A7J0G3A7_9ERIC|nr:hypothetical protein Acr_17g0008330 [Actinidia rufa]